MLEVFCEAWELGKSRIAVCLCLVYDSLRMLGETAVPPVVI